MGFSFESLTVPFYSDYFHLSPKNRVQLNHSGSFNSLEWLGSNKWKFLLCELYTDILPFIQDSVRIKS